MTMVRRGGGGSRSIIGDNRSSSELERWWHERKRNRVMVVSENHFAWHHFSPSFDSFIPGTSLEILSCLISIMCLLFSLCSSSDASSSLLFLNLPSPIWLYVWRHKSHTDSTRNTWITKKITTAAKTGGGFLELCWRRKRMKRNKCIWSSPLSLFLALFYVWDFLFLPTLFGPRVLLTGVLTHAFSFLMSCMEGSLHVFFKCPSWPEANMQRLTPKWEKAEKREGRERQTHMWKSETEEKRNIGIKKDSLLFSQNREPAEEHNSFIDSQREVHHGLKTWIVAANNTPESQEEEMDLSLLFSHFSSFRFSPSTLLKSPLVFSSKSHLYHSTTPPLILTHSTQPLDHKNVSTSLWNITITFGIICAHQGFTDFRVSSIQFPYDRLFWDRIWVNFACI